MVRLTGGLLLYYSSAGHRVACLGAAEEQPGKLLVLLDFPLQNGADNEANKCLGKHLTI